MGLLSKGTPLDWANSQKYHAYVKEHGILQFLAVYAAQRGRSDDLFLWGDEVEHLLLRVSPRDAPKRVQLCLRAAELIEALEPVEGAADSGAHFLPEYGRFMIEATPSRPYGGFTADLRQVEANMRERRALIGRLLRSDERLVTLTAFPLMGCPGFAATSDEPCKQLQGPVADSDYIMDQIIGAHPRFATLSRNIRTRRGARVDIRVPLFNDTHTQRDVAQANAAEQACLDALAAARAQDPLALPHPPRPSDLDLSREIHMDAMAFGMGMCCGQVTFQTRSIGEARRLYDHLAVLSPLMLALTAASPFYHGRVADIDARWTVISQSVDDRTPAERGLEPAEERNISGAGPYKPAASSAASAASSPVTPPVRTPQRLYKSRYDSISTFISLESDLKASYNDLPCEIDEQSYNTLLANDVDELLARHIAHLFVRDPLVIYDEHVHLDDAKSSDHFENIQSTNWQTVRFKPPTPGSTIGWCVEFRTMEVQITDFENAAFTVFVALVSRALLYFNLNFYIPLSRVDENLARAHHRDAVLNQKFFWRKHIKYCSTNGAASSPAPPQANGTTSSSGSDAADDRDAYEEVSIRDIMLGSPAAASGGSGQPGLINLVRTYLDMIECDELTRRVVDEYLDLISKRASGELMTNAAWMRKYVSVHPAYAHNSLLNDEIVHDLVETCDQVVKGTVAVPQLLGQYTNLPRVLNANGELEDQRPSRELKGAQACSSAVAGSGAVLDLSERGCCEKLRLALAPYLQQANSLPSTPHKIVRPVAVSASTLTDSETTPTPWLSPSPSPSPDQ